MEPDAKITEVLDALEVASAAGVSTYLDSYEAHYQTLHSLETLGNRRLAEIKDIDAAEGLEIAKVAVLLNDTTFLSFKGRDLVLHWYTADGIEKLLGKRVFELYYREPIHESLRIAVDKGEVALGFAMSNGNEENAAIKNLGPLIKRQFAIPRPSRLLFYLHETKPDGSRVWGSAESPPGGRFDTWDIRHSTKPEDQSMSPIAIKLRSGREEQEEHLCRIILPFLNNVSISDLALILDDERDVLDEFRAGIRLLVTEASRRGADIEGIANDLVRPKIAEIERRFAKIVSTTRLRLSGAIMSMATVSLASYVTSGIGSAIMALGGATGLMYFTKEYASGKGEIADLKGNPAYLLWRIQNLRPSDG